MKTLVCGGGAAGCFAAVQAALVGEDVLLLERGDRLGRKLRITGKGRCNLTNHCDTDTLMRNIPRGGRFLYSAFAACSPEDVMAYFEGLGVPLKTERGNRVFPVSDKASDIADALVSHAQRLGVEILHERVSALLLENGVCRGVRAGGQLFGADRVILATGGMTYPATGSEGDGYRLAAEAGHTITPLRPSLVPLETIEPDAALMQGISLRNVRLTMKRDGKTVYSEQGEMLFTHFGVSGPLVLSASAYWEEKGTHILHIDLKPALSPEQVDARLRREIASAPKKSLSGLLRTLLPSGMVQPFLARCGVPEDTRCHSLTKAQRHCLGERLKDFPFTVTRTRPMAEGIVTRGGVDCREVFPKTMASRLVKNLYFAGEVLDCDGLTGGFNLQIAWSSAYLAGRAAQKGESL